MRHRFRKCSFDPTHPARSIDAYTASARQRASLLLGKGGAASRDLFVLYIFVYRVGRDEMRAFLVLHHPAYKRSTRTRASTAYADAVNDYGKSFHVLPSEIEWHLGTTRGHVAECRRNSRQAPLHGRFPNGHHRFTCRERIFLPDCRALSTTVKANGPELGGR
jgi:hypothetical protein